VTLANGPTFARDIRRAEQFRQSGQTRLAADVLRGILAQDASHFTANYALGMLMHQAGRNDLALPLLQVAVDVRPEVFEASFNLGVVQRDEDLLAQAQANLDNAVAIEPDKAIAHITLGMLLMDRGRLDEALAAVEHGMSLEPDDPETWARLGMLHQIRGEPGRAAAYYRKVIAKNPLDGTAHRSLAFLRRQNEYNQDIRLMEKAIGSPTVSPRDRMLLGYALGKVFDDLGQHDKAFAYLHEANQSQRRAFKYAHENQQAFFQRHKQGLDRSLLTHCAGNTIEDPVPIFVMGMPRSGTSLVEQILASHPQAWGAGEVEYTRLLVETVERLSGKPFPLGISAVPPRRLRDAGQAYIDKLKLNAEGAERVIDKLPHNFLRAGLFAALMPRAKIVLCERNPLDNCFSIYQHVFGPAHAYSSDLKELGQYYGLYRDLMDWWEQEMPGHIYRVEYERLVSDTENQVRRLLAYCELPFDEACLSFHKTRRQVKTPSAAQVREPVYQGSIGRWKNYEKHLGPLIEALP
jgi:tetratricopeptide (TPR) repeat protein